MVAVLLHIWDMLGGGSCHGVKVSLEYCAQKKLQRKHEKYHTCFMLCNVLDSICSCIISCKLCEDIMCVCYMILVYLMQLFRNNDT